MYALRVRLSMPRNQQGRSPGFASGYSQLWRLVTDCCDTPRPILGPACSNERAGLAAAIEFGARWLHHRARR